MTTIIGTGEVGALHSREELEEMQRLPLQRKIQITTARIIEWYQHYDGKVYVAFSGGKDSTVLLDIVRRIYPDVPAVFSDTGLEFPEVREFVKSCENVTIVRPEMNFRKVIEVYGYPVVSKRVANTVEYGHKPGSFRWKELHGEIMRSNGTPSEFNCEKWCYLLDAPFKVSSRCCTIMKKQPMKKYSKETGRVPIIATMANESRSRRATWLRMGCNAFSGKKPSSQPMSFWTEEDVLEYLAAFQPLEKGSPLGARWATKPPSGIHRPLRSSSTNRSAVTGGGCHNRDAGSDVGSVDHVGNHSYFLLFSVHCGHRRSTP